MYSQFRAQYPMGSLTTELLHMQEGHYVVKASIKVGDAILATGLSAAETIEQAEDSARARALVVLGIEGGDSQVRLLAEPAQAQPARLGPAQPERFETSDEMSLEDMKTQWPVAPNSDWLSSSDLEADQEAAPEANGTAPLVEEFVSVPKKRSNGGRGRSRAQSSRTPEPVSPHLQSESGPIDLSDIIAQTDVELKRLGWTNAQGRQYLQRTYNKRSRQQLTDEELMEFLQQLQEQTTASEPPF